MNHSSVFLELMKACHKPGCPVCRLNAILVEEYLGSLFYEYVNDPETRDRLVKNLGFCREHAGLLLETRLADVLGGSIIYENILGEVLRNLANHPPRIKPGPSGGPGRSFEKNLHSPNRTGRCVACEHLETASDRNLDELKASLTEEEMRSAYEDSDGLCFPHLVRLLERIKEPETIRFLFNQTQKKLKTLHSEMAEVIRKHDYRFQSEGIREQEALAWRKAMCMLSGATSIKSGE